MTGVAGYSRRMRVRRSRAPGSAGSTRAKHAVRAKLRNTAFLVPGVSYVLRQALDDRIEEQVFHFEHRRPTWKTHATAAAIFATYPLWL